MIVFNLKCDHEHQFEAWFRSSAAYEEQHMAGLVACPYCESIEITKAPMAPNIPSKSNQKADVAPVATRQSNGKLDTLVDEAEKVLAKVRDHVKNNCDYVGDNFAEEARKIHYGESEERGIYGESTKEETVELLEEGIDILPLPVNRQTDS